MKFIAYKNWLNEIGDEGKKNLQKALYEESLNEVKQKEKKILKKMSISDFPHVINFFKKFYPDKKINNIPVYVISEENWPERKGRQTENDRKGGINIHEDQVKIDSEIGWLIHEVGHVLELRGEKKPYLVSKKEFNGYPNEDDEQVPMWYQFHYLLNKGLSEDEVLKLEKRDYQNGKGTEGVGTWKDYKDKFFRAYYKEIKKIINEKAK